MNIDLLPKSRHIERRNGRCKFIGHSYVSFQHYLSKPVECTFMDGTFCSSLHTSLSRVSPVRAQMCLSKPLPVFFHRWFSCLAFYLPPPPILPHEPSSQCPVKKQAASLTYWYFWHNILFSFNPLIPYIAFTLDSGIVTKQES